MKPSEKMKQLIDLAEQVYDVCRCCSNERLEDAAHQFLDEILVEIHEIVKDNNLQYEYEQMSCSTILEYHADLWLSENPFNPELTGA